ncbi:MAG TPA: alpha/beta hydrolase [Caulobacterales bacterium]|nr:alpha/beta hydrolase [Caulobacterales bacterium]
MKTTRRGVAGGMAAMAAAPTLARAMTPAQLDAAMAPEGAPREIVPIWPGRPPGLARGLRQEILERSSPPAPRDRAVIHVARPVLIVFRAPHPNGAAVLITPGGAYQRVVLDKEGFETAERLNDAGVTAFVLIYRLPGDRHAAGADAPLQDAQRALRVIRSRAHEFNIDPARTGVMGFSAGGHVAGSLSFRFDAGVYAAVDAADAASAKPAFSVLVYPVATMGAFAHAESRTQLLGTDPSEERRRAYSLEHMVRAEAPPCFLLHAEDDPAVRGHGFGLRLAVGKPVAIWPQLALDWMRAHAMLT